MNIHCRHCGEPFDIDHLHTMADDAGCTFAEMQTRFARYGCDAEYETKCTRPVCDPNAAMYAAAMQDLSGDADDWASDGSDFAFLE